MDASQYKDYVLVLGSEQIVGSGVYAVRGYPESRAFGDRGLVLRNELHLPPFLPGSLSDASLSMFAFHDVAWLRTVGADADSVNLSSVGLGAALRWGSAVSLDMAVGRPLRRNVAGEDGSRVHFRLQVAY